MIKRHFFLIAAGLLLILMLVAGGLRLMAGTKGPEQARGGGGGGGGGAGGRAVQVSQVRAQTYPFTDRIEVLGVAKGRESVTITSGAAELITRVRFRDGQAVRAGQVLVDLQSREQDADIIQAQATLDNAKRQYARWESLAEQGVAPRATADQYRAQYQQAQAALAAAQARKGDRVIRAPFSGIVGLTDVTAGALINPGTPIVTLDDISTIRIDFDVPDRYLPFLREGTPISARPDAYPGQVFVGRIAKLDTRVDENTRALKARAVFPNPARQLKPGMLMRVTIDRGGRQSVAVPEAAVQFQGDQASVFVLVSRGGKLIANQRTVRAGARENGMVEIMEGLQVGEPIVADGVNRVEAGQAVRLVGARRPGGAKPGAPTAAAPARTPSLAP